MAGQLVNVNGHPKFLSLKEVLESAQTKQYTYRGEMFSGSNISLPLISVYRGIVIKN